jgi:Flp pilus assembly protein TadD
MIRPNRFGTVISALALAATLTGCAVGQEGRKSFASSADNSKVGLATRAQVALSSGQVASAVDLAEQAVQFTPDDAGFRKLLANCYFAAGRFASAEQAYRDSLTLNSGQPDVVLKLALVEIGQGRNADALAALTAARDAIDPADYGLAIALAGHPAEAVAVLDQVARQDGADARVRQNLALAYGMSGDWTMARTVAAQDLAPGEVDARVQQWMQMATPAHPYDQLAALTGVHPTVDPGQPQRLALKTPAQNQALAQLLPKTQPDAVQPQPPVQVAELPPLPPPPAEEAPGTDAPATTVAAALLQAVAPEAPVAAPVVAAAVPALPTRFDTKADPGDYVAITKTVRKAAEVLHRSNGNSSSVVQLGAYSSPDRVSTAWSWMTKHFPALASYTPVRARYDGPSGTVWRLSIKGFASDGEARDRCEQLQSRGGHCFVRRVAGDAPVQLASR